MDNPKEIAALEIANKLIGKKVEPLVACHLGQALSFIIGCQTIQLEMQLNISQQKEWETSHWVKDSGLNPGTHQYSGVPLVRMAIEQALIVHIEIQRQVGILVNTGELTLRFTYVSVW